MVNGPNRESSRDDIRQLVVRQLGTALAAAWRRQHESDPASPPSHTTVALTKNGERARFAIGGDKTREDAAGGAPTSTAAV
jgi:hypothetical protein